MFNNDKSEAIEFANRQIRNYHVGEYVLLRTCRPGADEETRTVYEVVCIQEGKTGLFSNDLPVFRVKNIINGTEENLIQFLKEYKHSVFRYKAQVFPFANYNASTKQYQCEPSFETGFYQGFYNLSHLDNVGVMQILHKAIDEKKKREEFQRIQEKQLSERQILNGNIRKDEISEIIDRLRK